MMHKLISITVAIVISIVIKAQSNGFQIVEKKSLNQVDILYGNKLLTAFCYYDSIRKPILFPVNTLDGITVTRGYPIQPKAGERTDHPHHNGIWFNYESVNGLDFWNNSTAIPVERRDHYGTVKHQKVISKKVDGNNASLTTSAVWVRPDNKTLLNEETVYKFSVQGNNFLIDRVTKLTATDTTVFFKDVKDGLLAIRVARELEMPSKEASNFVDDKGNLTTVKSSGDAKVTGMYVSSEGLEGDSVWSSRARWVVLKGKKEGKDISIGIIDHPSNVGYPAYWHARGYGLFAVNPLGQNIFSKGKEELNLTLQPKQSATFTYRIVIHSGSGLTKAEMNKLADDFKIR